MSTKNKQTSKKKETGGMWGVGGLNLEKKKKKKKKLVFVFVCLFFQSECSTSRMASATETRRGSVWFAEDGDDVVDGDGDGDVGDNDGDDDDADPADLGFSMGS
jgi:hypothetical protein